MHIIGLVGFAGSGKGTAAQALIAQNYVSIAYADAIKDALAAIFRWPRELLEGNTDEGRIWRETVDPWWSDKLQIPDFSPRRAMQLVGTNALRNHFHPDIWVLAVERAIHDLNCNVVIPDVRFPNEIALVRRHGGTVIRVQRGPDPDWMEIAAAANQGCDEAIYRMEQIGVHVSEWAWVGSPIDRVIVNDGSVEELWRNVICS
jgi:hypothetical protein